MEVEVLEVDLHELADTYADVDEYSEDGVISALVEGATLGDVEQCSKLVVGEDWDRCVWDCGGGKPGHWIGVDFAFEIEPLEELL